MVFSTLSNKQEIKPPTDRQAKTVVFTDKRKAVKLKSKAVPVSRVAKYAWVVTTIGWLIGLSIFAFVIYQGVQIYIGS